MTWHDVIWHDVTWHDTAWHDRAPAGWSCAAAPCWGRCYSAERKPAIDRVRTPSPAEVAAAVPQPPGRPRSGASGAAWWWPAPQGGKMQRTQRHWLLGSKQVSNLVFYAQSTITVISGWLLLGREAGESNSSSQWATFKGGGKTSQKNHHKKSLKEGRKHHKKTQKRGEDLTEKVSLFPSETFSVRSSPRFWGGGGELEIAKKKKIKERENTSQTNFKGGGKTLQKKKKKNTSKEGEDITICFQGWDKDPHKKRRFSRGNIATKATPFAVLLTHKKPPCHWCSTCLTPGCLWRGIGKFQNPRRWGRWSYTQHYTVTTRMVQQYNGAGVWAILMVCWLLGKMSQDHVCTPQLLKRKDSWGKLQLMYIRLRAWHVTTRPNWLMPAWWKATHLLSHHLFCNYSYLHIFVKLNLH